jgi:hypothetical protein
VYRQLKRYVTIGTLQKKVKHFTLTVREFNKRIVEKHNLIQQTALLPNAKFPWPPIMPKPRECILCYLLKSNAKIKLEKFSSGDR